MERKRFSQQTLSVKHVVVSAAFLLLLLMLSGGIFLTLGYIFGSMYKASTIRTSIAGTSIEKMNLNLEKDTCVYFSLVTDDLWLTTYEAERMLLDIKAHPADSQKYSLICQHIPEVEISIARISDPQKGIDLTKHLVAPAKNPAAIEPHQSITLLGNDFYKKVRSQWLQLAPLSRQTKSLGFLPQAHGLKGEYHVTLKVAQKDLPVTKELVITKGSFALSLNPRICKLLIVAGYTQLTLAFLILILKQVFPRKTTEHDLGAKPLKWLKRVKSED